MAKREDLGSVGQTQFDTVIHTFRTKKLRGRDGQTVKDLNQALAIAYSEGSSADERGVEKRTWKGRTRVRPKLKKK